MSTIDEIMGQADDYARAWADAQSAEMGYRGTTYAYRAEEKAALRDLIAAALAGARRDGAEAMRSECLTCCDALEDSAWKQYKPALGGNCDPHHQGRSDGAAEVGAAIRAMPLPLPTGERKDEPLVCDVCGAECADPWHYSSETTRHMHACDACWPGVRKQGGELQAVLLEDWQLAAAMSEIQPGDELAAGFSFLSWQSGRPDAASALDEARLVQAAVLAANGLEVRHAV